MEKRTHTRQRFEGLLQDLNHNPTNNPTVFEDANDILIRMHAHHRHLSRVEAAKDAALAWVRANVPGMNNEETPAICVEAAAWLCCQLDANGIGGPFGAGKAAKMGPPATNRFPAFWQCGSGRRYASDGEAWTAAIASAAHAFNRDGRDFKAVPNMPFGIGVDCGDTLNTSTNIPGLPDEWIAAFARGRAWAALEQWHWNGEPTPDPYGHLNMARQWAEIAAAFTPPEPVYAPCSLCGKDTGIEVGSTTAEWYLCHECVDTPAAKAAGYTHD